MFEKLNRYIKHIFPLIKGFIYNHNFSFISLKSKVDYNTILGPHTIIHDWCIIKGDVEFGSFCSLHEFSYLQGDIKIGNHCRIGSGVKLFSNDHKVNKNELINRQGAIEGKIRIHDDVWIGANVIILKNVTVGKGAVIGAGSVVTKDVPEYEIWVGNPARKIKERV